MVSTNLDLTFTIIWSLALANIIGGLMCFGSSHLFAKITTIQYALIAPAMLTVVFFGAFQASQRFGDIVCLFLLGIIGVFLRRFGWSRPAFVIGFVLSDQLEGSVYRAVQIYGLNFFDRPIVIFLLILILVTVFLAARMNRIDPDHVEVSVRSYPTFASRRPQVLFTTLLLVFVAIAFLDSFHYSFLSMVFPMTVSIVGTLSILAVLFVQAMGNPTSNMIQDNERVSDALRSSEHYLLWILGYIVLIYLVGFVIASPIFIYVFTNVKSDATHRVKIGIALGCLGILMLVAWWLELKYLPGLLQQYVALPWWLG